MTIRVLTAAIRRLELMGRAGLHHAGLAAGNPMTAAFVRLIVATHHLRLETAPRRHTENALPA